MAYSQITPIIGQVQEGYFYQPDTIQREILGTVITAVDNYLGFAEFMYCQFPASTPVPNGSVVTISGFGGVNGHVAAIAPVTSNTGRAVGVCFNNVASVASIQYGWVQISGAAVIKATASVAAGTTVGIDVSVPGSIAANSAGRQVLGAVSLAPSTTTVVKTATLTNGTPIIRVSNVDGWVIGLTASGTGVSGTITAIDPDSRTVTLSANSTAGGSSSVTMTYTGFNVVQLSRPILQGAIT